MTPVVDRFSMIMTTVDTPDMLRDNLPLGDEDKLGRVDMQTDGPVRNAAGTL